MIQVMYLCRQCADEIPVRVILGESDDLPINCPACEAPIPEDAHENVQDHAVSRAEMEDE
jgi:hypothetical protein